MSEITATLVLTVGLTFYGGDFEDKTLACGGTYTEANGLWAAVPIEWNKAGYVSCGDILLAKFTNGQEIRVPVRDFGCHLHYPVWDSDLPMGADFPRYGELKKTPTGTGQVSVEGWTPPPMDAWGTKWCNGPLTMKPRKRHRPR